jgi:hypothetical protein
MFKEVMTTAEKYHGHFWIEKVLQKVLFDLQDSNYVYPNSKKSSVSASLNENEKKQLKNNFIKSITLEFTKKTGNSTSKNYFRLNIFAN